MSLRHDFEHKERSRTGEGTRRGRLGEDAGSVETQQQEELAGQKEARAASLR